MLTTRRLLLYVFVFATTILLISLSGRISQGTQADQRANISDNTPTATTAALESPSVKLLPRAEATLTDQELLELSVEEDSNSIKPSQQKTDSPLKANANPTTSSYRGFNNQTDSGLDTDDARSLFAPLSEQPSDNKSNDSIRGRNANRPNNNGNNRQATPTPLASATPDTSLPWVSGQARGYAMLYALHPRARAVVEKQVATLLKAKVREPYISVLIDGTFGRDFDYLETVIERLSADGRRLTLALYISNGPTMRIWDKTPIRTDFSTTDPLDFRYLIQYDETTRNKYAELVDKAREMFEFNLLTNRSNKNIAVPMLEDNLDRDSYRAARAIAAPQLDTLVKFVRNPCEGCFKGNNGEALGDALEDHRTSYLNILSAGDGFTLDGLGFYYSNTAQGTGLSPQKLNELIDATLQQSLAFFGLWRHGWQGVIPDTKNVHPDQRNYVPSTEEEADFEITALRRGLTVEDNKAPAS